LIFLNEIFILIVVLFCSKLFFRSLSTRSFQRDATEPRTMFNLSIWNVAISWYKKWLESKRTR